MTEIYNTKRKTPPALFMELAGFGLEAAIIEIASRSIENQTSTTIALVLET